MNYIFNAFLNTLIDQVNKYAELIFLNVQV